MEIYTGNDPQILIITRVRELLCHHLRVKVGKGEGFPLPPRCRNRVNSLYYTGVRLSRTGRPLLPCPHKGTPPYSMPVDQREIPARYGTGFY